MLVSVVFDLVLSCGVIVVPPVVGTSVITKKSLSIFFPLGWLLNKKVTMVEVNILLAYLHWVEIALHP